MARQSTSPSGLMIDSNEELCGSFDTAYCHLSPSYVDEKESAHIESQLAPLPALHSKPLCQFKKDWRTGKQIGWGAYSNVFSVTRKHTPTAPRTPPASTPHAHCGTNSASKNSKTCTNVHATTCTTPEYAAKVMLFTDEDVYQSAQDRINAVNALCNEFKLVQCGQLLNYVDLYYDECNYYKAVIVMERLQHSLSSKRNWNHHGDTAGAAHMYSVKKIARDLASNIQRIHALEYAHLDIKKENIMWNATQRSWQLIDFGFARYIPPSSGYVQCKHFVGTKRWTAPEIAITETLLNRQQFNRVSKKCDVYSFGLVVLNVAVGGDHYRGVCAQHTEQDEMQLLRKLTRKQGHRLLRDYLARLEKQGVINRDLYAFLAKILVFDPAQRPSIEAVLEMDYLKKTLE